MTEQIQRDRLADHEKFLERFATLTVEIAMLKVAQGATVSKGALKDELDRIMVQVRKERDIAMSEMKTEMKAVFGVALKEAFDEHAKEQQKSLRLYTRIGILLLAVLVIKDAPTAFSVARGFFGIP